MSDRLEARWQDILAQLAQLTLEEQEEVHSIEERFQQEYRRREAQHRQTVAALERQRETDRDNAYDECEIRKQLVFEKAQAKRDSLLREIQFLDDKTTVPEPQSATPDPPQPSRQATPKPEVKQTAGQAYQRSRSQNSTPQSQASGTSHPVQVPQPPSIASQRNSPLRWIPIGTRVWVLSPLKLKNQTSTTYLEGVISRHGSFYHFLCIWNPATNKHEEHRRHRDSLAVIE